MIKKEKRCFIVYIHLNATTDEVFYVGIGKRERIFQKYKRSNRWIYYVNKYGYYYKILFEDIDWFEACKKEKELISFYGRKDLKKGSLINMTNGGDGSTGHKGFWNKQNSIPASEETKRKCRENSTKPFLGRTHTEESKAKIRAKRGEQINVKGVPKGNVPWNKGVKSLVPNKNKGKTGIRKDSDESRIKKSIAQKKRHLEKPLSKESNMKRACSIRNSGGYERPTELREKISEGVKRYYATK